VADTRISTAENPIPCPVLSPSGVKCSKNIHPGWTVEEGHSGGHFWVGDRLEAIFRGGHYDATAAISMQPFEGHLPEECPGESCPYRWRLDLAKRVTRSNPPGGAR
jgi:hypothetical protein